MGSKNKQKSNQKRKQKDALKKARRRAAQKPALKTKKPLVTEEMFPDEDLLFWLAHGVNYMLSDYDTGTWTPVFEEIYEGAKLTPEDIARRVVDKYSDSVSSWPPEAEAALAWSVQPRESVYFYFLEILRRLKKKGHSKEKIRQLAVAPHNGVVWGVFRGVFENMQEQKKKRAAGKLVP